MHVEITAIFSNVVLRALRFLQFTYTFLIVLLQPRFLPSEWILLDDRAAHNGYSVE